MIWKNRKIRLLSLFALPVLSCLFCLFGCSSKSSAFGWVYNQNINAIPFFTTYVNGNLNYYTNYDYNVSNPWTALYENQSGTLTDYVYGGKWNMYPLYGGNIDYLSYNILEVYLHVNGTLVDGAFPTAKIYAGNDDGTWNPSDDCSVVSGNAGSGFDIRCIARYTDNIPPKAFDIELLPYQNISTGPSNWTIPNISNYQGPITIEIDYRILSYPDPNMALIAEQNGILLDLQNGITTAIEQQQSQDAQDRENISNISGQSTQDGNNASQNFSNSSASLLGVITGVYNQLLHPVTTNCTLENVQIYDMTLGNLDFCTLDIPQPIFAIGSILMLGLVILLAWTILRSAMSLYNDLLGGKG